MNVIYFHLFTNKVAVLVFKHEDLLAQIVWLKSKHVHDWEQAVTCISVFLKLNLRCSFVKISSCLVLVKHFFLQKACLVSLFQQGRVSQHLTKDYLEHFICKKDARVFCSPWVFVANRVSENQYALLNAIKHLLVRLELLLVEFF